jgi:hypothetical protein
VLLLGDVGAELVWFCGVRGELEYWYGEDELELPALLLSPKTVLLGMLMEEDMVKQNARVLGESAVSSSE